MKKLTVKRIVTIILIALLVLSATLPVFGVDYLDPKQVVAKESNAATKTQDFLFRILGIVQVVAVALAVIMLIILGVKYVSAAPAEKADIKQGAMIYVVGAILMFGATGIIQIIKTFAGDINK